MMRTNRVPSQLSIVLLSFMLVNPAGPLTAQNGQPLGKVLSGGSADINGISLTGESTLFAGDVVTTRDGWVRLLAGEGEQAQFVEYTRAEVRHVRTRLEARRVDYLLIQLHEGSVAVSFQSSEPLRVETACVLAGPYTKGDPVWQVTQLDRWRTQVSVEKGKIRVMEKNRASSNLYVLEDGQSGEFNCSPGPLGVRPVVWGRVGGGVAAAVIAILLARDGGESPSVP